METTDANTSVSSERQNYIGQMLDRVRELPSGADVIVGLLARFGTLALSAPSSLDIDVTLSTLRRPSSTCNSSFPPTLGPYESCLPLRIFAFEGFSFRE
jgi:hypothetical protein